MTKKVLITGGTGFLGVYLARYFLKKKFDVVLLDIEPLTDEKLKKNTRVVVVECDVRDKRSLLKHFSDVDYVVHAAAALPIHQDAKYIWSVNVDGTRNVMDAALKKRVKKVVFISSTATYGMPERVPETEGDPLHPIGVYGETKVAGEKICMEYYKKGLSVNVIRPKTFLGPERLGVFTIWFEAIYNNKPIFILGDGNNLYQLLDAEDLCGLIHAALVKRVSGEIFNAGAKDFGSWRNDLNALIKEAGSKSKIVSLPVLPSQLILSLLERLHLSPIVEWHYRTFPINSFVSIKLSRKKLGFRPTKSNTDILIETYLWYKKNHDKISSTSGTTHRKVWNFKLIDIISRFV